MKPREVLVAISSAQLAAGLAGLSVAVWRRRNYDLGFLRGRPEHVARDSLLMGTAYSAPAYVLAVQVWAIRRLAAGPDDGARRLLGVAGAVMTAGYLAEKYVRAHLSPRGFDPIETPVVVAGVGLAAAMAVLGHQGMSGA
jgi:hypothetical protein